MNNDHDQPSIGVWVRKLQMMYRRRIQGESPYTTHNRPHPKILYPIRSPITLERPDLYPRLPDTHPQKQWRYEQTHPTQPIRKNNH